MTSHKYIISKTIENFRFNKEAKPIKTLLSTYLEIANRINNTGATEKLKNEALKNYKMTALILIKRFLKRYYKYGIAHFCRESNTQDIKYDALYALLNNEKAIYSIFGKSAGCIFLSYIKPISFFRFGAIKTVRRFWIFFTVFYFGFGRMERDRYPHAISLIDDEIKKTGRI